MTELSLEYDQLVARTSVPLGRAELTSTTRACLWALRIFTVLLAVAVVCAFVAPLV